MPRRLLWNNLARGLTRADADMLLETLKTFNVAKSDASQCSICSDASPHAMRTQMLRCGCAACMLASPALCCPWRGRVRSCKLLDVVNVDELNAHVTTVRSSRAPQLTLPMKEAACAWAKQGLRPARIWHSLLQRFHLDETSAPTLAKVQRFVHHYVATQLGGSDMMAVVRSKVRDAGFTDADAETQPFTFTWRTDTEGRPVVGNGSDASPFVVGVSTKKLLRQADREPSSFMLHIDATYKLTQVGYPVIVVGISDRSRRFHVLAIFIVSQLRQPQSTEVLSLLARVFVKVTGNLLRVRWAMADADVAQWNALHEVFGNDASFCTLMCYFHVSKKIYEKTRALDDQIAAMVLRHVHELHFSRNETQYLEHLAEVQEEWGKWNQLNEFAVYFNSVWLNERTWRWQCYHTPSGFAATNNPCETYNASIKRDVTLRRKLKVGALLDRLFVFFRGESVRAHPIVTDPVFDDRLIRRTNAMAHAGLLREYRRECLSIAFLLGNITTGEETQNIVNVIGRQGPRVYDVHDKRSREDLPVSARLGVETARMELLGMPSTGWAVDVERRTCPCGACFKYGCCIHLLYALETVGGVDMSGRETLVYRGPNKRKRVQKPQQPSGRPRLNGPALSIV